MAVSMARITRGGSDPHAICAEAAAMATSISPRDGGREGGGGISLEGSGPVTRARGAKEGNSSRLAEKAAA
eukprot:4956982-Prymnesium_polylepis.1